MDKLKNIFSLIEKGALEGAKKGASKVLQSAKKITPTAKVNGGTLKQSLNMQQRGGREIVVGTNVEYAPYVEFGHRTVDKSGHTTGFVEARPYLRPALEANKQKILKDIENGVKEAIND